jgi:predicted permease
MNDVRYALRQLAKHPGFTLVAVLTLALGIGANTAIFSVVDGVLLRPAPFEDAKRLAMVWETDRASGTTREPASVPDYLDFVDRASAFSTLAAFTPREWNLIPDAGDPMRLAALHVTHQFLPLVGIRPLVGRAFTPEEDLPGTMPVAMISEGLWERLFARDPAVLERSVSLDGVAVPIVGVLPAEADFGTLQVLSQAAYQRGFAERADVSDVDLWIPLRPDPEAFPRETHPIFVIGRLTPGVSTATAQDEMTRITADLEAGYPENAARGANVEPLEDVVFGGARPALYVLLAAVALVLLVACGNVANLVLVRGTARMRDVALRTALGADGARLARQFLVEGIVLAAAGGLLGALLAVWGTQALVALAPHDIPRLASVAVNLRVLVVTSVVSVAVGVAFGFVPMMQARRLDLQSSLKSESAASVSGGSLPRVRSGLVVAELALAVMLVIGAGLLLKSFWRLMQVDPGFRAAGVLKAEYQLPRSRYPADFSVWPDFREMHDFNAALLTQVAALAGVEAVAVSGNSPLDAGFTNSFAVVGREAEARDWPEILVRRVSVGYFQAVGLALRAGRGLDESDRTDGLPVVLINEAARERFFPDGNAIGAQIALWGAARTIVGEVANEKILGLAQSSPPALYLPLAQAPSANGAHALMVRTRGDPAAVAGGVRNAVRGLDRELAVFGVEPLRETVSRSVAQRRFTMLLLGSFAVVALALAVIGVHGVLSFAVARRIRELGVRMALGATRRDVLRLVARQGLALAGVGLGLGLALSLVVGRVIRALLFGVTPADPFTYLAVVVTIAGAVLLASWLPARRATRVDPMEALRYE